MRTFICPYAATPAAKPSVEEQSQSRPIHWVPLLALLLLPPVIAVSAYVDSIRRHGLTRSGMLLLLVVAFTLITMYWPEITGWIKTAIINRRR